MILRMNNQALTPSGIPMSSISRVEERRGCLGHAASLRFLRGVDPEVTRRAPVLAHELDLAVEVLVLGQRLEGRGRVQGLNALRSLRCDRRRPGRACVLRALGLSLEKSNPPGKTPSEGRPFPPGGFRFVGGIGHAASVSAARAASQASI